MLVSRFIILIVCAEGQTHIEYSRRLFVLTVLAGRVCCIACGPFCCYVCEWTVHPRVDTCLVGWTILLVIDPFWLRRRYIILRLHHHKTPPFYLKIVPGNQQSTIHHIT